MKILKNNIKSFVVFLLSLTLLLSFTACGDVTLEFSSPLDDLTDGSTSLTFIDDDRYEDDDSSPTVSDRYQTDHEDQIESPQGSNNNNNNDDNGIINSILGGILNFFGGDNDAENSTSATVNNDNIENNTSQNANNDNSVNNSYNNSTNNILNNNQPNNNVNNNTNNSVISSYNSSYNNIINNSKPNNVDNGINNNTNNSVNNSYNSSYNNIINNSKPNNVDNGINNNTNNSVNNSYNSSYNDIINNSKPNNVDNGINNNTNNSVNNSYNSSYNDIIDNSKPNNSVNNNINNNSVNNTTTSNNNQNNENSVVSKNNTTIGGVGTGIATPVKLSEIPAYSSKAYCVINGGIPNFSAAELTTKSYEKYTPLDRLGRVGVAVASLSKDTMPGPNDTKDEYKNVKPTGWKQAKYTGTVSGGWLYHRCHMIAYSLCAEDETKTNLMTGTQYFNIKGMAIFEDKIRDYIKETGNHVAYRVTPIFSGNNLLAHGAQLEAYSIEDNGKAVCFNVFCYNVQPGITINYATGASSKS